MRSSRDGIGGSADPGRSDANAGSSPDGNGTAPASGDRSAAKLNGYGDRSSAVGNGTSPAVAVDGNGDARVALSPAAGGGNGKPNGDSPPAPPLSRAVDAEGLACAEVDGGVAAPGTEGGGAVANDGGTWGAAATPGGGP